MRKADLDHHLHHHHHHQRVEPEADLAIDSTRGRLLTAVHSFEPLPPFNALATNASSSQFSMEKSQENARSQTTSPLILKKTPTSRISPKLHLESQRRLRTVDFLQISGFHGIFSGPQPTVWLLCRFVVSEEELVAVFIDMALKSYAREGRLPVLGSDLNNFLLYCPNAVSDALNPWETIGLQGARNFILCKKPPLLKSAAEDDIGRLDTSIVGKRSGSWKSWINKSLN